MGKTTFSGPIKAGTINDTTGTTIGTNVTNVGSVLMAQSMKPNITGASQLNQRVAVVPANSQIVDVILNVTTAKQYRAIKKNDRTRYGLQTYDIASSASSREP